MSGRALHLADEEIDNHRLNLFGVGLRAGLTVEQAAQRYSALLSPDLHHLLTRDMGWPAAQHQSWVTALLEADLLTDPGCGE